MKNIVIIGGGASGLISAIISKNENNNVTIIERYDKCGRKILVSGNGRCNYWNEDQSLRHYHSENLDFINEVITSSNMKEVIKLFDSLGIEPFIKNGYYYPFSMQSITIRDILLREVKRKNINIIYNKEVTNVEKFKNKYKIHFEDKYITSDKLIIATGSNAYYKEENKGYEICQKLGHSIINTLPSLVQLNAYGDFFEEIKGIRANVLIRIIVDNKTLKEEKGEILFTDYGLSGICVFNLSRIAGLSLKDNKDVEVSINFLHLFNDDYIEKRVLRVKHESISELLEGVLNEKLIKVILKKSNIYNNKYNELSSEEKESLEKNLTDFRVKIKSTKSFKEAQTSTGGIDTREVNSLTMESKIVKDLYIVGEILDVDGDCGGYNLSFSWISGLIAGRSVNND